MSIEPLSLKLHPDRMAICQLSVTDQIPSWALIGNFVSITRTDEELSIVCAESVVPDDAFAERGWRCLGIVGQLDFSMIGIIQSLTTLLARQRISVFVISTYRTDYFLVKEENLDQAVAIFRAAGHVVE